MQKSRICLSTWFGLVVVIEIGNGWFHRAGFGKIVIPHPPAINWLLRLGLPNDAKRNLIIIHEFGHLQTLPLVLIYFIISLLSTTTFGDFIYSNIFILIVGTYALWEMLAEIYTLIATGPNYKIYYEGSGKIPRVLFWLLTIGIFIGCWLHILL